MIKCPTCGTVNLEGSQFCDECGTPLAEAGAAGGRQNNDFDSVLTAYAAAPPPPPPNFQSANITSVGVPTVVEQLKVEENKEEAPAAVAAAAVSDSSSPAETGMPKGVHAVLVIERGASVGTEFGLTSEESNIGRWDADNGIFPDVDLDAHDPEAKVSRRHARIVQEDGRYLLEDLGSTNGTFINRGRRLIPGMRQPLSDGDEVIVGKTFLRFRINQ
ncbi:MAG TPA: FHA domain-containing protein [Pyrinomonadaceae bacterium]|nr:FHA domain-containing protein [Pyrinomonadaceae bacterium]